ncbi:MAG TPA: DNA ligase D [Polyangia bacterium]|nr:DNA ligase D [Polyangia bacterium]
MVSKGAVPDFEAQLATLVEGAPEGDGWLHEQKFDGYRIGLRKDGRTVELWSRRGQDWTAEFPAIAGAGGRLAARRALLDGELAAVLPNGVTSFQALQNRRPDTPLAYFVFDLLHLDGEDLREQPIEIRKEKLRALLDGSQTAGLFRYSDHVIGGGVEFHGQACGLGLEGIVSKRLGTRYRAGRNLDWQKTKCVRRQEFVLGGFTDPEGARAGVGALLIGYYDGAALRWAGKVGTGAGWNTRYLRDLRRQLEAIETKQSPFDPPVDDSWLRRNAHWVQPKLVAEIAFGEWTEDGRIRHPSMQGLRADKDPRDVRREQPTVHPPAKRAKADKPDKKSDKKPDKKTEKKSDSGSVVRGITISHPDRVIYADLGLTKLDVARYYGEVAPAMMPHVRDRPLTLLRCGGAIDYGADKGGCVMLRHGKAWGPRELRRVKIRELRKTGEYLVADTPEALVALAQMGIVEVHTWNAGAKTPYVHDRVVFDFDPGPEVGWREVVAAARLVRQMLDDQKLRSFVKTTGGKGLHVVVPIAPTDGAACLAFSQAVAAAMVESDPRRFTTNVPKAGREKLILVDALRNGRANTAVAAFSLRARRGAPVSMPLDWDELTPRLDPARFTIRTAVARAGAGDPWADYWTCRQNLPTAAAPRSSRPPRVRRLKNQTG